MSEYTESIKRHREEKNQFFRKNPRSPIEDREGFEGLNYFSPDEDFRFEVELEEFDEKGEIKIGTTTGEQREYLRWGQFNIEINGKEVSITAYKSKASEESLWVPIKDETSGDETSGDETSGDETSGDETSGDETYGTGRYIEVDQKTDEGLWILDLNQAYNPYCAYNDEFDCPLVPGKNNLDVRIEAGEKKFHE